MTVSIITDFTTANAKGAIIQGPLDEILRTKVQAGCRAYPSDVAGAYLEMGADGLWTGASVGTLTQVQADALVASGALDKVKAGTPGTVEGTLTRWDGSAWVGVSAVIYATLALMLAATGIAGQSVKCTDPMFGPMGAMFDWAQSLGKWVPRNARIYGTGVGTTYTASAGDINTQVQVGTLAIPDSLIFAGVSVAFRFSYTRPSSGAAGTVSGRLHHPVTVNNVIETTLGQDSDITTQGFARHQYGELYRAGARTGSHGFGAQNRRTLPKDGDAYRFAAQFNAPTAGMIQTLSELYAELSYGG